MHKIPVLIVTVAGLLTSSIATAQSAWGELPEIIAKVNKQKISRDDIRVAVKAGQPLTAQIDAAILNALAAQQARKEGLDKDPGYVRFKDNSAEHGRRAKWLAATILVDIYRKKVPALVEARQASANVEDVEVIKYIALNSDRFGTLPDDRVQATARTMIVNERFAAAESEWLTALLLKKGIKVNDKDVPAATIEAAMAARQQSMSAARKQPKGTIILDAVTDIIGGRDALADAVIAVAGEEIVVGELPVFAGLAANRAIPMPLLRPIITTLLAAEARKEGIDKDPEFVAAASQAAPPSTADHTVLAGIYWRHHGIDTQSIKITDAELRGCSRAIAQTLMAQDGNAFPTWLAAAKKEHVKAEVTASELTAWYDAIFAAVLDGNSKDLRTQLLMAKLGWKRSKHLETALAAAKIKRYVD
ncbi:MAG TPA: hypothetical protein DIT01_16150 [Lentisphaeria bacterium]|nr:hypothetical protein [Lentisphaeria bacterium]